jgi:sugar phosphate isomerase/epimerase
MKFGISSWFYQDRSIIEALNRISECGFGAVEIWMHHLWKTKERPQDIARCAKELGLTLSLHDASYDVNMTSINPWIRKESLRQTKASIETAPRLGAELVVVHPGRLSASKGGIDECWGFMREALTVINEWAQQEGVRVGIEAMENKSKHVFVYPSDMMKLLGSGGSQIGLTMDIAHAAGFMDPVSFIEQIDIRQLVHVHLSDGTETVTHAPLGTGRVDIDAILNLLDSKYNGLVIVEGYVPGKGSETVLRNAQYLKERGWL